MFLIEIDKRGLLTVVLSMAIAAITLWILITIPHNNIVGIAGKFFVCFGAIEIIAHLFDNTARKQAMKEK